MRNRLLYYSLKYSGDYEKIKKAINRNEKYEVVKYNGNYITICDKDYPSRLKRLYNPPYVLYYKGNKELLNYESISIIGSRLPSLESETITRDLLSNINLVTVSGLAKGIDAYVHKYTRNYKTIAILGCGINYIYPKCNTTLYKIIEDNGLIISEYPDKCLPLQNNFRNRNRIIAALSNDLIVIECTLKSGSLITVKEALEIGNEIYVVPQPLTSNVSGNNFLIAQGANIIYDINNFNE